MKYILLFFLSLSAFAQHTNLAIISLEKTNIVYRGIDNPIKIAVPGAENVNVTASGGSLKPIKDQPGAYSWNVTAASGTKAKITITYIKDGNTRIEAKEFRINNIEKQYPYLGKYHSGYKPIYYKTRAEAADIEINTTIDNFYFEAGDEFYKVIGFRLYLPKDTIFVQGNILPDSIKDKIYKLQKGTTILINDIYRYNPHDYCMNSLPSITIEIVDDPLPIETNDLPRPIIYNPAYETLYRGTDNRLKISVPDAKSFIATAPGLQKIGNRDDYTLRIPKDNKENRIFIDFEIVTKTDSVITYKQMFIPKDISIKMLINGQGCEKCIVQQTHAELKNAEISVEMPDIRPFNTTIVRSFKVILPDGGEIQVKGNRISTEALYFIEFLKPGEMIIIDNIYYNVPGVQFYGQKRYPIKIMLIQ